MFILAATRTPFYEIGGELSPLSASDLGRAVVSSLLLKTGIDPAEISEVIFGCAYPPIESANIARSIALRAGIPGHVPASTVQRNSASGLEALTSAHQRIAAGQGELFLVGATESMSNIPLLFPNEAALHFADLSRAKSSGQKLSAAANFNLSDFRPKSGLEMTQRDLFTGKTSVEIAEKLARESGISKTDQDNYAAESRAKAESSRMALSGEICPVFINGTAIQHDSPSNPPDESDSSFGPTSQSVTHSNSCQNADGAVAFLVGTEAVAQRLGLDPLGRVATYAYAGCDPLAPDLGPLAAIERAKQLSGLTPDSADLIEIHEAFAVQALAIISALEDLGYEVPAEKINRHGGSIAFGHPTSASGPRMILSALGQLRENTTSRALVTTSISGGQGAAIYLEKP
ncbi:thiolase family protein [Luteolibacter sp. AS25]|uniref:thiolase family protein n=1 Tax=Luteolibacter sp. AS25 TaxID=3135776 RepID=UPI00398B43F8